MKLKRYLFVLCTQAYLLLCGCATSKPGNARGFGDNKAAQTNVVNTTGNQPMVVSYIVRVTREDTNSYNAKFEVMNVVKAAGSVKPFHRQQNCTRCLEVRLLGKNRKIVEEQRIYDPLYEEIEYLESDSTYNNATVKATDKTILIRTNSTAELKQMQFRFTHSPASKWIKLNL